MLVQQQMIATSARSATMFLEMELKHPAPVTVQKGKTSSLCNHQMKAMCNQYLSVGMKLTSEENKNIRGCCKQSFFV